MQDHVDIEPKHAAIVSTILQTYLNSNILIWVFGSRANNNAKKYSDLDLALEAPNKSKIDIKIITKLELAFEESELPWKVDIIDLNDISATFKEIVVKSRVLFELIS